MIEQNLCRIKLIDDSTHTCPPDAFVHPRTPTKGFDVTPSLSVDVNPADVTGQRILGSIFDPEDVPRITNMTTEAIERRFIAEAENLPLWLVRDISTLIERVQS